MKLIFMIDMKRNNKKYMIKDKIRSRELLRLKKITKVIRSILRGVVHKVRHLLLGGQVLHIVR